MTESKKSGMGVLLVCAFLAAVSNSGIFAALSDLQDKYGFSDAGLGYIAAAGFLTSVVVSITVAPFADRGHPKMLVIAGLTVSAAGSALFALSGSLFAFIVARGLIGAAMGTAGPAIRALAANLDPNRAAERLGRLRGIEMAGFTGGPLIGALLIEATSVNGMFVFFCSFAVFALVVVAPRELPTLPSSGESQRLSLELLRLRPIRAASIASLTLFLPVGIYDALWDRYVTDRGGTNLMVGLSFLLYSIPFVLFGARGGRIADQRGARTMALIGIACAAPVVCVYGLLTNAWLIVLFGTVEGLVGAIALPAAQSMMARAAPEGRAAAAQGLMGAGDLTTAAIVSLIAPMIYGSAGPEVTFAVAAGAMAVLGLLVAYESRDVRN